MRLRDAWKRAVNSAPMGSAGRAIGILAGGSALAQLLSLIALPVVTRLYSPEDFGVFAVYTSLVSILSVAACLRLDVALPLPEDDRVASDLLVASLLAATAATGLLIIVLWSLPNSLTNLIAEPALVAHLWWIPAGVWCASTYSAFQFWCIRHKQFSELTKSRIGQSLVGIVAQVGGGVGGVGPLGLIVSQVLAATGGLSILLTRTVQRNTIHWAHVSFAGIASCVRTYKAFPKYSTIEALANAAGIQVPILIIAITASAPEAGFVALVTRIVGAPMNIIGSAVAQVFIASAADASRSGSLPEHTRATLRRLATMGVAPVLFLGIVAPSLFELVFGAAWRPAGAVLAWMAPWFLIQFLVSPVSMSLHVIDRPRLALKLQFVGALLRIGSVGVAGLLFPVAVVEVYAATGLIFYTVYLLTVTRLVGITGPELMRAVLGSRIQVTIILAALAAAIILRVLI